MELATFGGGCFWCTEAIFQQLEGVESVVSGYAGGTTESPSYEEICTGNTGHAEVIQIRFNPEKIRYEELLEIFFKTHDPTTLNRQGNDVGTQYRSIILYHTENQQVVAKQSKAELEAAGAWSKPIVTEIVPFIKFYPAEDYHQNFYRQNPNQGYCRLIIRPKLEKLEKLLKNH
ncbi:MAG: peptide-methionine (S)-S-oxide reductase MsrA [Candidatus Hodarchaeales archaeon]|jgi:peptide-methionine (S)-S-oxide reductase